MCHRWREANLQLPAAMKRRAVENARRDRSNHSLLDIELTGLADKEVGVMDFGLSEEQQKWYDAA